MANKHQAVIERASELVEPVVEDLGFELVDVEYLMDQGRWVLRLYIDKEQGVTLDDCARVSTELGDLLDVKEVVEHGHVLEVSSPGLNRPLKKEKDFIRAVGKKIKVRMDTLREGRQNYTGYLKAFNEGRLHLDVDGQTYLLPREDVQKAHVIYEFGHFKGNLKKRS